MIGKNLRIAVLLSLGVHISVMSAVTIITPEDLKRTRPYTRVDFLGPILRKTAFDIMLENVDPVMRTTYRYTIPATQGGYLRVVAPKRKLTIEEFPGHLESDLDSIALDFLAGSKGVPDFASGFGENDFTPADWPGPAMASGARQVIYKPPAPFITRGFYGSSGTFRVRVRALIAADGNVSAVEPLATTGYPHLDIVASKFVKGWIFEPKKNRSEEAEWYTLEVVLSTGD